MTHVNARLFSLGRVVSTPGALAFMMAHNVNAESLLHRHQTGDWGVLCDEDRQANAEAVRDGGRVMSSYPFGTDGKLWIITEWDRSVTTILLPMEY